MGNSTNKMYQDGDVPREYMEILLGPSQGWAYYNCSKEGVCESCQNKTNYWHVTVKSRGKYLCETCRSK